MGKYRGILFTLLLGALALRLVLFTAILLKNPDRFMQPDSFAYWQIGGNIARHATVSSSLAEPLEPESNRTPVYPMMIAAFRAFDAAPRSVILFQIFLSLVNVAAAMFIAGRFLNAGRTGTAAAGAFIAFDIPSVVLANSLLTETLFTTLVLASVTAFLYSREKGKSHFIPFAGIMLGLSALCRPSGVLLPVFLLGAAALVAVARRLRPATDAGLKGAKSELVGFVLLLAVYAATVAPWVARNDARFGYPFISTIGYDNLLTVQASGVESVARNIPYDDAKRFLVQRFEERAREKNLTTMRQLNAEKAAMAAEIIRARPLVYARNYAVAIANMLLRPIRSDLDMMLGLVVRTSVLQTWGGGAVGLKERFLKNTSVFTTALCGVQVVMLVLLYGLFIAGIVKGMAGGTRENVVLLAAVIGYFCFISGAPETYARFRVPVLPYLAAIAALGLQRGGEQTKILREGGIKHD